jgi:hypothetical protein
MLAVTFISPDVPDAVTLLARPTSRVVAVCFGEVASTLP